MGQWSMWPPSTSNDRLYIHITSGPHIPWHSTFDCASRRNHKTHILSIVNCTNFVIVLRVVLKLFVFDFRAPTHQNLATPLGDAVDYNKIWRQKAAVFRQSRLWVDAWNLTLPINLSQWGIFWPKICILEIKKYGDLPDINAPATTPLHTMLIITERICRRREHVRKLIAIKSIVDANVWRWIATKNYTPFTRFSKLPANF